MRTTTCVAAVLALLAACAVDEPTDTTTVSESQVEWDAARTVLEAACVHCHAQPGSFAGLEFLAGGTAEEVRQTLMASGMVDFENPPQSRILTKGVHEGPSLRATDVLAIFKWIESEAN